MDFINFLCLIRLADDIVLNSLSVRGYSSVDIHELCGLGYIGMRAFFRPGAK